MSLHQHRVSDSTDHYTPSVDVDRSGIVEISQQRGDVKASVQHGHSHDSVETTHTSTTQRSLMDNAAAAYRQKLPSNNKLSFPGLTCMFSFCDKNIGL